MHFVYFYFGWVFFTVGSCFWADCVVAFCSASFCKRVPVNDREGLRGKGGGGNTTNPIIPIESCWNSGLCLLL